MKRLVITLSAILVSCAAIAQNTTGKISYKETLKLDIQLEGDMAQFAEMLPKEQSFDKVLHFTPEASIYKTAPKEEERPRTPGQIRRIMVNDNGSDVIIYRDLKENKVVSQKEFMTRKFLVSGDPKKTNWKMTGEQKDILGYPCQQATAKVDSDEIAVWFTPAIPVASGPQEFGGLPGMILEASVGKSYTIVATEVKPGEMDKKELVKPKEGKKISSKQFDEMMKEKLKEMQEEYGGAANKNIIIKVQH